jgi:mRNA-degrading endonuclease RelE of RelBE toxin-antitoxin system
MSPKRREVLIAPKAVETMRSFKPSDEEFEALKRTLTDLGGRPTLGFKIPFINPALYRLDVGRFRVHYAISVDRIDVSYIGVY